MIGERARSADARVEFAEIHGAVILIDEEIEIEIAAIAFPDELVAELERHFTRRAPDLLGERPRVDLVAAPAALVRRQLLAADHFGQQRADEGARSRRTSLHRGAAAIDAFHELHFALVDYVIGVLGEVLLIGDEEGSVTRIAERSLDHEIAPELVLLGDLH